MFRYTKIDDVIRASVSIEFVGGDPCDGWPGPKGENKADPAPDPVGDAEAAGKYNTDYASKVVEYYKSQAEATISGHAGANLPPPSYVPPAPSSSLGYKLPLQFPPRVKSISKAATWNEINVVSYEPMLLWLGSGATTMSLELIYAVIGASSAGGWGIKEVSKTVHAIMGYFYRSVSGGGTGVVPPLVRIKLYEIAPVAGSGAGSISTWVIDNASVAYSDEIVEENQLVYPQVATVTMSLKMQSRNAANEEGQAKKQYPQWVAKMPKKEWY